MKKPQEPARPGGRRSRLSGMPAAGVPRLALSGLVHRALLSFQERDQQRRRLINILILAQALLFLAAAPAYVGSVPALPNLIIVGVEVAVCLVAWVFSQFLLDAAKATYLLVIGGSLAVLSQVLVAALGGDSLQAAHASLLLLTILLEAGLLFAPEVTLFVALGAVGLSGIGLVLALAIGPAGSSRQEYVLLVSILGLQVVTALIAWLLSGFIYDTAVEAERAHALQFAQVRLDALTTQMAEQRRQVDAAMASLQETMRRVLAGETSARAAVSAGDFSVLAGTLNVVLERFDALAQPEAARQGLADGLPLIDLVGHGVDSAPGRTASGGTPDAIARMGADPDHLQRRLARVQQMAGELVGALVHSQDGLTTTAHNASEALRTVGAAIAAADGMLTAAQHGAEQAGRVRRAMSGGPARPDDNRPDGLTPPVGGTHNEVPASGTALRGLGPDLDLGDPTPEVETDVDSASDEDVPPTSHSQVASARGGVAVLASEALATDESEETPSAQSASKRRRARGTDVISRDELSAQLADVSPLLAQLAEDLAQQEQAASRLTHELGIVNRNARGVDVGVAWAAQAVEAIRRNAERLYQTAGGSAPPSGPIGHAVPSPLADLPMRAPQPTRPLSDSMRLPMDAMEAEQAAGVGLEHGETVAAQAADDAQPPAPDVSDLPPAALDEHAPEATETESRNAEPDHQ